MQTIDSYDANVPLAQAGGAEQARKQAPCLTCAIFCAVLSFVGTIFLFALGTAFGNDYPYIVIPGDKQAAASSTKSAAWMYLACLAISGAYLAYALYCWRPPAASGAGADGGGSGGGSGSGERQRRDGLQSRYRSPRTGGAAGASYGATGGDAGGEGEAVRRGPSSGFDGVEGGGSVQRGASGFRDKNG